ncbi:MAG: isopenicillin N synthase family oxygenase [Verrucomicrobia bacterium]|nr:isopenicillin N synthase family oxygenase [Verrucomicrobiota bacterium]
MIRVINPAKKAIAVMTLGILFACEAVAMDDADKIERLSLDVISYQDFASDEPMALSVLEKALLEKGIVGIRGIPGYQEKVLKFIEAARAFSALPENVKESYAPNHDLGELFLGYERGKERFKRPDGRWVVDDLKVSYYGFVPDCTENKWPREIDLRTPFQEIGSLMSEMGESVMKKIGLIGSKTGLCLDGVPRLGRMLYYRKSGDSSVDNPFWCGSHFDHGMFTALLPAFYFKGGQAVPEPLEAGLFVKTKLDGVFKKVVVDDPDVLLFQVGEFGQLASNDAIKATEHRVHKASGSIERHTMALFFDAPMEATIHSYSELTEDARYGGVPGDACTYRRWNDESFKRYIVKEEKVPEEAVN